MFNKTKIIQTLQSQVEPYRQKVQNYLLSLRDVRNIGVLAFTVILLLISWSGIKTIQTNYGLQKQIATLQQQNDVSQLQNHNLQLQNEYYNTPQYLEVTARQNLGLAAPGETELLITPEVALAHTVKQANTAAISSDVPKQPTWQRNFQAWIDFFLGRGTTD